MSKISKLFCLDTCVWLLFSYVYISYLRIELYNMSTIYIESNVQFTTIYILSLLLISSIYILFNARYCRTIKKFLRSYIILWVMIAFVSILSSIAHPLPAKWLYGAFFLPVLLSLFVYTYISKTNEVKLVLITLLILLIVLLLEYVRTYNFINELTSKDVVTNSSYFIIYTLPFILLLKNKNLRILLFFVIMAVSMSSIKRGGTISVAISFLTYLYLENKSNKKNNVSFLPFFLTLISFYLIYVIFLKNGGNAILTRFSSILDDGGSGRLDIWKCVIDLIASSNIIELLIGHGWDAVVRDTPFHLSAHNDALEIIYNFGILTFVLYFSFHIVYVKSVSRLVRCKSIYAAPLAISYVLFFVSSLIAHVITYFHYITMFSVFWGVMWGVLRIGYGNDTPQKCLT